VVSTAAPQHEGHEEGTKSACSRVFSIRS
jgi:hypothetical protein